MNTEQNYGPAGSDATPVAEFINRNADLIGQHPGHVAAELTKRLQHTPVAYGSALDGIALLRTFMPVPPAYTPSHYALILRGPLVVGFTWVSIDHDTKLDGLFALNGDTRQLIKAAILADATGLLLSTTQLGEYEALNEDQTAEFGDIANALSWFNIDLLDWLLLYANANVSLLFSYNESEFYAKGLDNDDLFEYCLPQAL